jgi:hypothetical protein
MSVDGVLSHGRTATSSARASAISESINFNDCRIVAFRKIAGVLGATPDGRGRRICLTDSNGLWESRRGWNDGQKSEKRNDGEFHVEGVDLTSATKTLRM